MAQLGGEAGLFSSLINMDVFSLLLNERIQIAGLFPNLKPDNYKIIFAGHLANASSYNCVAQSLGVTSFKIDHYIGGTCRWIQSVSRDGSLESYVNFYEILGFEICDSASCEQGLKKLAIYSREYEGTEIFTHAALQVGPNTWRSKLGDLAEIEHKCLRCLESADYGKVTTYMKESQYVSNDEVYSVLS